MTTPLLRTPRIVRLLAAVVLSTVMVLTGQAFHVSASAADITWVDGGDDSPCLNDDKGRALDALPADQFCTPIPGCYQGDDGKWVLPSRKNGIWQGDASQVRYADEAAATPTPVPTTPKPTTPATPQPTKKPSTPKPGTPTTGTPTTGTPTKGSPTTAPVAAPNELGIDADETAVTGAPTAPEAPVLAVDGSDITVTWTATGDAALESVTGYQIQISGAEPVDVDAVSTSHTFKGLDDGTYRAAVRAVNSAGASVASTPSDPVTIGKPIADTKGQIAVEGDLEPGASVALTGTGYAADVAELTIELHSDPVVLGTVATDDAGGFRTTVTIPADVPEGAHSLVVLHEGAEVTSTPVQVAATTAPAAADVASAADAETVPPYTGLTILAALGLLGISALAWHVSTGSRRRARVRHGAGATGPGSTTSPSPSLSPTSSLTPSAGVS